MNIPAVASFEPPRAVEASSGSLVLVSHPLCPYVQRAAIVLLEKGIPFERRDIDLGNKPDWFLALSPLGMTPLLLADNTAIFESAVICEYLDEVYEPRLHPQVASARARHRGWVEFASGLLSTIAAFYNAPDEAALQARACELRHRLEQIEQALGPGPFFDGSAFSLVDAAFAPVWRYFAVLDPQNKLALFDGLDRVVAWRNRLLMRSSVRKAVSADYRERLVDFILARRSALSHRLSAQSQAA